MLVPVEAYRDEGVSYHYAKPTDYLVVETAQRLIEILEEIHIPYNTTKTWTTDAFYRETENNLKMRKNEGCGVVEMECASIMSVGQFRKKEVYQFLYAARSARRGAGRTTTTRSAGICTATTTGRAGSLFRR